MIFGFALVKEKFYKIWTKQHYIHTKLYSWWANKVSPLCLIVHIFKTPEL